MAQSPRTWTHADQALLYTCHLVADRLAGRPMQPAQMSVPFPPQLGHDERYLAADSFTLSLFQAVGDGSYEHDSGFFFATGKAGLAATAGLAAARAVGNSNRRNQAAQDAVARWVPRYTGGITVSDHGIYFKTFEDFFSWDWGTLQSAEIQGFNTVLLAAPTSDGRTAHWLLQSPYAELAFVLWATERYPRHPQLDNLQWLPPNWVPWAREQGHLPALGS